MKKDEREFLLDTHIWLWYLLGSDRLPEACRSVIDASTSACWFSPVSVWEIGMLAKKRRIDLLDGDRAWVTRALDIFPLKEASLTREVALRSNEVELPHDDPADHFLAATALVFDLTLITVDQRLIGHEWLPTLSA